MECVDKYIKKCQKRLKEWDAPLLNWYCTALIDITEDVGNIKDYATCELCDCSKVRFIHVMHNDNYFEDIHVGCICAGIMEGNILVAEDRERQLRNRANRRKTFIKKKWSANYFGGYSLKYRGQRLSIFKSKYSYSVRCKDQSVWKYKGKPIRDILTASYAAFDLIDPVEKVVIK